MGKRNKLFLYLSISGFGGIIYLIFAMAPTRYSVIVFFFLIFSAVFFLSIFIFNNLIRGAVNGLGVILLLLLLYLKIFNTISLVVLIAFLTALHLSISTK